MTNPSGTGSRGYVRRLVPTHPRAVPLRLISATATVSTRKMSSSSTSVKTETSVIVELLIVGIV